MGHRCNGIIKAIYAATPHVRLRCPKGSHPIASKCLHSTHLWAISFFCPCHDAGESLGTPHLSPYLKALGSDFSNGANFAIGGSTATPGGSPFSLDVQLHQFLYFRTRSFELLNKGLPILINNLFAQMYELIKLLQQKKPRSVV